MGPATHYEHSGKAPLGGILLTLIVGTVAGVVLGAIYGFLIEWSPFIYINLFITLGFSLGVAAAVASAAKLGKIRNATVVTVLALLVATLAYGVHWAIWISQMTEAPMLSPKEVWEMISAINLIGPWSIFGWTPTGFSLWAIWGIEAAAILGISAISARGINDVPFCEATGRWATEVTLPLHFAPLSDTAEFNSPGSLLGALSPAEDDSAAYTTVSVSTVEESDLRCVSIESVTVETNKKGEEQTNKTNVVKNLLFDRDSFEKLLRIAQPAANQEL
jgi:hypothetical protein